MATKIYFAASIRGGRQDAHIYSKIVALLKNYGKVMTEHVGDVNLTDEGEYDPAVGDKKIHDRDIGWIRESNVLVAEVTQPSLGVGYELGRAATFGTRILCLFRPMSGKRLSGMIRGADDGQKFVVKDYEHIEEVERILKEFFSEPT